MRLNISMKMDYKSITKMMANVERYMIDAKQGAKEALKEFGERVMIESAKECPRDTWTLVNTRWVGEPRAIVDGYQLKIGYGGRNDLVNTKTGIPASKYMVKVHEDLITYHSVGNAKFLENPVRRNATNFRNITALNIKANTKARYG